MGTYLQMRLKNFVKAGLFFGFLLIAGNGVYADQVIDGGKYDFGFTAVDFKICHDYLYINKTTKPVKLQVHVVSCDCSAVRLSDTLVAPGDTSYIRLEFDTGELFGPTEKSFTVSTTDPAEPIIEYSYITNIGQWIFGLKPDPPYAFFLPVNKSKKLIIHNPMLKSATVSLADQADTSYRVSILKGSVNKGELFELEVSLVGTLPRGTYLSSFRLKVESAEAKAPVYLTVPVKIVRY